MPEPTTAVGAQAVADYFRNVVAEIDQTVADEPSAATHYCIAIRVTGRPDLWDTYGHEIPADQFRAFVAERDQLLAENAELRSKIAFLPLRERQVREATIREWAPCIAIEELGLDGRPYDALHSHGVESLADLFKLTEDDLGAMRNMGAKSVANIKERLSVECGLTLAGAAAAEEWSDGA